MRKAEVFENGMLAGTLEQADNGEFIFCYDDRYFIDSGKRSISLTLPKNKKEYRSAVLFPFFFNMLSEGANKRIQCLEYKIDEQDHFGLLLATADEDTIGAITLKRIE